MKFMQKKIVLGALAAALALGIAGCATQAKEVFEPVTSGTVIGSMLADIHDRAMKAVPEEPVSLIPTEPYYVLIIGNDSREGTVQPVGNPHADVCMAMRIDPTTYQISLFSLPRDTLVYYKDKPMRLNEPYRIDGVAAIDESVKALTGLEFSYYVDISMAQFVDFYNAIGGVDAYATIGVGHQDIITGDYIWIEEGEHHLNGNEALVFGRVRKAYYYGDPCRQNNNRKMMQTTINMCAEDPELALKNLDILLDHVDTNWPVEELTLQVADFCEHASEIHFVEGTGPYEGGYNESIDNWACYEDPELWANLMEAFTSGGDPTTVLPLAPMYPAG